MCVDDSRSGLGRKTFALSSYVSIHYSRERWSRQLLSTAMQTEQQETQQERKRRELCCIRGITDWTHPNLLCSELDIAQISTHRAPEICFKELCTEQCQHSHHHSHLVPKCQHEHPLPGPLHLPDCCSGVIRSVWK